MKIITSVLSGVISVGLGLGILYLIGMIVVRQSPKQTDIGIGWDPVSALTPIGFCLCLLLIFAAGFWATYRFLPR